VEAAAFSYTVPARDKLALSVVLDRRITPASSSTLTVDLTSAGDDLVFTWPDGEVLTMQREWAGVCAEDEFRRTVGL